MNKEEIAIDKIMNDETEEELFLNMIDGTNKIYFENGPRSGKKVDFIHRYFKTEMDKFLPNGYNVELEKNIPYINETGKKKCDIVVFKNGIPHIVMPVKYVMSSYNKNKNNYMENLLGEIVGLKIENPNIYIIPVNLIIDKIPNKKSDGIIKNIENITFQNSFKTYDKFKHTNFKICGDTISYIIDVKHNSHVGEKYEKNPTILGINKDTPFRTLKEIIMPFIN